MAPPSSSNPRVMDQQMKTPNDLALKCPRCDSSNTKFCYYNNYSLTQPRHFCKACKRYWTRGGTLRNVPVGGGCRKNKRIKRTNTESLDHGVATSHLKATTETKESVSLSLLNCTQSLSSITTTSTATTCSPLQNPVFLSPQLHVNSSLVSSLKSVLSPGVVFPPKDGSLDSSLLHEQNGFNNIISMSGASSLMIPEAFPPLGHSLDGISSHISNGTMQHNQWRSSQVQPQNFFLPLDELSNCVDTQLPKINGENLRNLSVKVDDDNANRSSLELDWQTSNLSRFGTNSNETSIYWNPNMGSWPDLANYGSTVASLM